jgi:two-component system, NarL family, nitrate/nitrite response regulator NarL
MMHLATDPPIRVLLVDDHRTVLWGLEKLIGSAKPHMQLVGVAASGREALAAAEQHRPDVILLDLDLGDGSGLDLLPDLLQDGGTKVLILTGTRDPEVREIAVLRGARGMVHKTESAEMILSAIKCVSRGEIWLDRATTAKVIAALSAAGGRQRGAEDSPTAALTQKEREIVAAVVKHRGAPIKAIADALCLSSHTVRNHLASIYSKLGVHSRLELFMYAKERGLDRAPA